MNDGSLPHINLWRDFLPRSIVYYNDGIEETPYVVKTFGSIKALLNVEPMPADVVMWNLEFDGTLGTSVRVFLS